MTNIKLQKYHQTYPKKTSWNNASKDKKKSKSWVLFADYNQTSFRMIGLSKSLWETKLMNDSRENSKIKLIMKKMLLYVYLTVKKTNSTWSRWSEIMLEKINFRKISNKFKWSDNFLNKKEQWKTKLLMKKESTKLLKMLKRTINSNKITIQRNLKKLLKDEKKSDTENLFN